MAQNVGEKITLVSTLGAVVRDQRIAKGYTQREAARRLGVSQRWLSEVEAGKPKILDDNYLLTLATLGVTIRATGTALEN